MRNISFSLTTSQFLDGSKSVTRRLGWKFLQPGDLLCGCVKCMGLKPGEKIERLGVIEVVSVKREPLQDIFLYENDCALEGFPELDPEGFIEMFCRHMKAERTTLVTRIEFRHVKPDGIIDVFSDVNPQLPAGWNFEGSGRWLMAVNPKGERFFVSERFFWPELDLNMIDEMNPVSRGIAAPRTLNIERETSNIERARADDEGGEG